MSRKPIDQQQPSECRQAVWDEIRSQAQHGAFSAKEIADCTRLGISTVRDYLTGLSNAGYLVKVARPMPESFKAQYYLLNKDAGHHAPRVRKDGTPVTQGLGQQYLWNAMKILKTFTATDLAYNASTPVLRISDTTALDYIKHLVRANYIKPLGNGTYKLRYEMWTGPFPPQIQRTRQVYDPNLQRVVWAQVTGGAL